MLNTLLELAGVILSNLWGKKLGSLFLLNKMLQKINKTDWEKLKWFVCLFPSADCTDSYIHSDISADSVEYEAESWSLTVEHKFCKKQDKRAVKRQDVIYGKQMLLLWKASPGMLYFLHVSGFHM